MGLNTPVTRKAFLGGAVAATTGCAAGIETSTAAGREWFEDFVRLFYIERRVREAFELYVVEDYIQHADGLAQGREAAVAMLEPLFSRDGFLPRPIRTFHDESAATVFIEVSIHGETKALVIDIFRIKDKRIVEHWDVKKEIAADGASFYFENLRA